MQTTHEAIPYWRRTPPAIFPPVMGLFGLALAWRRGADAFGITPAPSDLILGAVTLCFIFITGSYLLKFGKRPGVVVEEIRVLPGLTGLSALTLSGILLAAGLVPFAPGPARWVLLVFLVLHAGLAVLAAAWFLRCPPEARRVAPSWHLTFIGFILVPFAALPLGMTGLAQVCFWAPMPVIAAIYGASLRQMLRAGTPAPLRPLLAIHMAPLAVQGSVAHLLGLPDLALGFCVASVAVLAVLVGRARWVTQAGFSPMWGAFTFPLTAVASVLLLVSERFPEAGWLGGLVLISASVVVVGIAVKVTQAWARGMLAAKTNAAIA